MEPQEKVRKVAQDITRAVDTQDTSVVPPDQPQPDDDTDEPTPQPDAPTPTPTPSDDKQATSNNKVVFVVVGAVALFIIGVLMIVFSFFVVGAVMIVLSALLVMFGVFLPVGQGDWNKTDKSE